MVTTTLNHRTANEVAVLVSKSRASYQTFVIGVCNHEELMPIMLACDVTGLTIEELMSLPYLEFVFVADEPIDIEYEDSWSDSDIEDAIACDATDYWCDVIASN